MPFSVWPSSDWQGNDGPWSTFAVRVGSNSQLVNLLPATSGSSIWPVQYQGCQPDYDPIDCPSLRGGTFDPRASNSFVQVNSSDGLMYSAAPFLPSEAAIGYSSPSEAGKDQIILQTSIGDRILKNQSITAYTDLQPFLGLLGLSAYDSWGSNSTDKRPSPLETLFSDGAVSAMSYGYTAGANWRNQAVLGSLTMGGYDELRGDPKEGITVSYRSTSTKDLVVRINSITIHSGSSSTPVPDLGGDAFIDSVVPEIWLPSSSCQAFQQAFGLQHDNGTGYYTVSEEQHQRLLDQNQTVTFTLAANDSSTSVDIVLPYGAFDLTMSYGKGNITDNSTTYHYFPIRAVNDSSTWFLGRTFLQEAYLAVDYHNREFHVSQAKPYTGTKTNLVCLGSCKSSGLSTGAIAGIAVGVAVVFLAVIGYLIWRWRKKRTIQKLRADLMARNSIGGTTIQEDETPNNMEFFKPSSGPPEEEIKPELDGQSAIPAGFVQYGRHELASNGSVRRTSQQSGLSRGTISPITQRMPSHSRNMSYGSSNGHPSPSLGESPSPGQGAWSPSSHPSPGSEMREVRHESGGQWYFELPANGSRPALQQMEPVEVRADPRSPVERTEPEPDSLL